MTTGHIDRLVAIVGEANCLTAAVDTATYTTDYRKVFHGEALAVVRPADTQQVSRVMAYCYENGIAIVPQGGNTSLLGGAVPTGTGPSVVMSLSRLRQIRSIDAENDTMVVDAGVTLADARAAAEGAQRLFPLRIGSEGTCQIGGNLSTNAGGTAVLRYGNMRDLVLGLEVVLPNGDIWHGLRALRKDNTGYDLKHLFVGSEGTLGVITAAVLKIFPKPISASTALVATANPETALELLGLLKKRLGTDITAFELISASAMTLVLEHLRGEDPPFEEEHEWQILIESTSQRGQSDADAAFQEVLGEALHSGLILDAVVAASEEQARRLWKIREEISDAQTRTGGSVRCDISVPLSTIPEFIYEASARVLELVPDARMVIYGHLGDGNVHFNPLRPKDATAKQFLDAFGESITQAVDEVALSVDGSISAEHGVGTAKRDELVNVKSDVELLTAWKIKQALDPKNLLNPGKVLPSMASIVRSRQ
jgi:FAD/FMN-containing dehydrogenase